jgi:hypothetical protein
MSFKSRDLTVKLSGQGEGNCDGGTNNNPPGCGGCTNTRPDCGNCSAPSQQQPACTDTATTPTGKEQSAMEGAYGAGLALLRQQLQASLGGR